jgi:hypothetical protein
MATGMDEHAHSELLREIGAGFLPRFLDAARVAKFSPVFRLANVAASLLDTLSGPTI